MDTPATITLIATALILGSFFAARMIAAVRENRLPPLSIYGDFPHVPRELAAPGKGRGGVGRIRPGAAETRTSDGSHSHVGTGV